ncbi:MAG: HAD hydrolase-like protein [Candidatus Omnitrophota bacterium]|nr:HAD hydrolase-like protein [Candidatus Omnitrophota bacterium]
MGHKRYSVIIFDLGNTLIKFDHNISAKKIANLFHLDSEEVRKLFFDSKLTQAFERGQISPKDFHARITKHLGVKIPFRDFVSIWNDIFWIDEGSCAIARRLKKDYKLFLLSNIGRLHYEYIVKKFDILEIFDEIIVSFAVGAIKPEKKIFEDAIKRAGGDRSAVLYIDDREDLIKEATSFGIESIKYEGAEKLERDLKGKGVI